MFTMKDNLLSKQYSFGGLLVAIKKSSGIQFSSPLIAHYFVFCCTGKNRDVTSR